jgi:hypothetical protein
MIGFGHEADAVLQMEIVAKLESGMTALALLEYLAITIETECLQTIALTILV